MSPPPYKSIVMAILLIILSVLLWASSIVALFGKQLAAPALSYIGMLTLSGASDPNGNPLVPVNNTILIVWLCMTLVVTVATLMQPQAITSQRRGEGYMLVGAIVGLAVGLLGFSFSSAINMLYGIMVLAVITGVFFGYLIFTNTPDGAAVRMNSGRFFTYLLAKGFPTAITVMMIGIPLVIIVARVTLGAR